jgi:hypothetical protein
LSIFAKDCPRCGETNAAYAVSCRCGFAFNSVDHIEEDESDISVTVEEEELYLEYLRARADQAAETAKRAARAAAEQPANKAAASQSHQAQAAAEQAKAELEQQRARMKVTMNVLSDDRPARQEQPASTPPARPQSPTPSVNPAVAPAKPATTPPVLERKEPASAGAKPAAAPPPVERKEPTAARAAAPAAKSSEPSPAATAKTPQDHNKYIPDPDNARATTATNSASQVTGDPTHSQTRIPTGQASARPETKPHVSTPAIVSKVVAPTAKTSATQAVPTKTEDVFANRQPLAGSASTTAGSAPAGQKDAGAPQAPRATEAAGKPATQGDAVAAKAAAAAARAKQLAEALKAAQAERAAKAKTSAVAPSPAQNENSKIGQEKPATSDATTVAAKTVPAPVQTPKPGTSAPGAAITKPVNGQQQKLNGHDKPNADINAIHIPGTELGDNNLESDKDVPKQAATVPATGAKQPSADSAKSAGDSPRQKVSGTPPPMADSKGAAAPVVKPAAGVTVTVTSGSNPQEELEAALKALSLRAPPPPEPDKAPADARDAGNAGAVSPESGSNPPPAAASTATLDELPSLEPVTPANQKDCPNCTALLPLEAKRCRCGFRFPEVEERMPGLSLSDSDFAALDGDEPSGITHL